MNTLAILFASIISFFSGLFSDSIPVVMGKLPIGAVVISTTTESIPQDFEIVNNKHVRYFIRDNTLYYRYNQLNVGVGWEGQVSTVNAHVQKFTVLQDMPNDCSYHPLAKDDVKVFSGYEELVGADVNTFTVIDGSYSKDKNHVYYLGKKLEGIDAKSLVVGNIVNKTCAGDEAMYIWDANSVFCGSRLLAGADPETFNPMTSSLAKDKNKIYSWCVEVPRTSSQFRFGSIDVSSFSLFDEYYFIDKNDVYVYGDGFFSLGADPKSFKNLGTGFSRDNNSLYFYASGKIENGDPDSFVKLKGPYSKDARNVYTFPRPSEKGGTGQIMVIENADPDTFEVILDTEEGADSSREYARDKNHMYYYNQIVSGVDVKSVRVFPSVPAIIGDDTSIYIVSRYGDITKAVNVDDPKTFSISKDNPKEAFDSKSHYSISMAPFEETTITKISN